MATYDSGVNPFMLYVKPVLMDTLNLNKQAKTVKDAWILKFENVKKNANRRFEFLSSGQFGLRARDVSYSWEPQEQEWMAGMD